MEITLQAAVLHLLDTHADQPVLADRPWRPRRRRPGISRPIFSALLQRGGPGLPL